MKAKQIVGFLLTAWMIFLAGCRGIAPLAGSPPPPTAVLSTLTLAQEADQPLQPSRSASSTPTPLIAPTSTLISAPSTSSINPLATLTTLKPTPFHASIQMLEQILIKPEQYLGQKVTVEGSLEAEGQMPRPRFFLRGQGEDRLEVTPWAPLEVFQSPSGRPKAKSMIYFVGRHLRLSGVLEKGGDGIVLHVASVEEL